MSAPFDPEQAITEARREFGEHLLLFGGIDWRTVMAGPRAMDEFLDANVRPVLEAGGYVPYLDDTIRAYMPFDNFRYYRQRLEALVDDVYA